MHIDKDQMDLVADFFEEKMRWLRTAAEHQQTVEVGGLGHDLIDLGLVLTGNSKMTVSEVCSDD